MSKIQSCHKEKAAYIYLRQSTMGQVRHNQESTERQYALKDRALQLGWFAETIRTLDGDLGISGADSTNRGDFKILVADVSMGKVGAVFALEASRLSRSCSDWHRLLELCALTSTLIIDEDCCYDPADFNDQLLLGLKGTMSQAELHCIRLRLQGGKLNKAKKGLLRFPLPVGFCYDNEKNVVLDPDKEVRSAVSSIFSVFREVGSAYQVVRKFAGLNWEFPKRAYGGVWDGKLVWGHLIHNRVLNVVKNPSYAGVYVYGRYRYIKKMSPNGDIQSKITRVPMSDWTVKIMDHHERYITWEEFLQNQVILKKNQTNGEEMLLSHAAREGKALLQGLLVCGKCSRRLSVRYKGNGGIRPAYECNHRKREGLSGRACMSVRADVLDEAISKRILEVIKPDQIKIAVTALEELEKRNSAIDNRWRMKIDRAEYEAELAQRRYEEVDPSNRLVAATLEARWDDALVKVEGVRKQFFEYQEKRAFTATGAQKDKVLALAKDLPRLWNSSTTKEIDRKRILRLLIKDITVEKLSEVRKAVLHIRWQGGACENIEVDLPEKVCDKFRYPGKTVQKIRNLAATLMDNEIVQRLNREGTLSAKGKPFTKSMVKWVRYKHRISSAQLRCPKELSVKEVAKRLAVSEHVVYYWIKHGVLNARRVNRGSPYWLTLDSKKEQELRQRVLQSTKIQRNRLTGNVT